MAEEGLTLSRSERELQAWVCDMEWPADTETQYDIMEQIDGFMVKTGATKYRVEAIIGWPRRTLGHRLARFARSPGRKLVSGPAHSPAETAEVRQERVAKKQKAIRAAIEEVKAVVHNPEAADIILRELDLASNREIAKIPERDRPMELILKFRYLHRTIDDLARAVLDGRVVVDQQEALLEEVAWLQNALGLIESGLRAGSLNHALAGLFGEEG